MDYQAIAQLLSFPSQLLFTWYCMRIQKMKRPAIFFGVFIAFTLAMLVVRLTAPELFQGTHFSIIAMSGVFVIPMLFSSESKGMRLIKAFLFVAIYILTDALVGLCYSLISGSTLFPTNIDASTFPLIAWTYAVAYPALFVFMLVTLPLFEKLTSDISRGTPIIPFASVLLSQSLLLMAARTIWFKPGATSFYNLSSSMRLLLLFAGVAWIAIDFVFFLKIDQDSNIQKRLFEQRKLESYQNAIGSVIASFNQHNDLLHKLRHDLANQIMVVQMVARDGKAEQAQRSLGEIRSMLSNWSGDGDGVPESIAEPAPTVDQLSGQLAKTGRASVAFGIGSGTVAAIFSLYLTIDGMSQGASAAYVACSILILLLCLGAHALCIHWIRSIQAKRLQVLDRDVANQAISAAQQMQEALLALQKERAALKQGLEADLIEAGKQIETMNTEAACDYMGSGLDKLGKAIPQRTGNAALDGVLLAKSAQCAERGVALEVRAQLPQGLPVSDIELSSMAFNLIDNALAGTLEARKANGQQDGVAQSGTHETITFTATVKAGQFLVSVTNPCSLALRGEIKSAAYWAADGTKHGLGTQIVSSTASTHGGIASFSAKEGVFTAQAMIPME